MLTMRFNESETSISWDKKNLSQKKSKGHPISLFCGPNGLPPPGHMP